MASNQRGPVTKSTPTGGARLVQRVIDRLKKRPSAQEAVGASAIALDRLESKLMVELPPSLRTFLAFDYTFATLGSASRGGTASGSIR